MKSLSLTLGLCATVALSTAALAQVAVKDPWVRATVPQQKASGAFMQVTAAKDGRLVEARSTVANVVEIHEMSLQDGIMRMRPIAGLDLPAGRTVELKPGGYHVMLMDLKQQLKAGDTVPITLVVEDKDRKRENIEVQAPVRPLTSSASDKQHAH